MEALEFDNSIITVDKLHIRGMEKLQVNVDAAV
jgi:hypothetical protein